MKTAFQSQENFEISKEARDLEKPKLQMFLPFILVHLGALGVFFVGFSWLALFLCLFLYVIRAFGLTAGFHRYFAHKSFKTSRTFQFVLAALGTSAAQMGPLWWSGHHRHHHRFSDQEEDVHSPITRNFYWAHVGWLLSRKWVHTNYKIIEDFAKFPEIRFVNQFHYLFPVGLGAALFGLGSYLETAHPSTQTSGPQLLVWGFFLSTTLLYHATFSINSLAHRWGTRRFETKDESRNNFLLAFLTLGEGWHNNHHHQPQMEKHGLKWWEIDFTHWVLWTFEKFGIVWNIRVPKKI